MAKDRAIDTRSREELMAAVAAGAKPAFLFFWGHTGPIEKACFSQWYPSAFEIDGERFATAEHWMMAGKARLFADDAARARVLAARTPAEAKKIGREVQGFDDARWRAARFELVVRGNEAKFAQNAAAGAVLRATAGKVLVEAAPRDTVWGIGLGAANERAQDPHTWRGTNLLGFALMEARARLFER